MSDLRDNYPAVSTSAPAAGGAEDVPAADSVACAYCMASIPSETFMYWTHATRLLSADCPECTRRTTLAARGLGPLPVPAARGISVTDEPVATEVADAAAMGDPMASRCACGHALDQHDAIATRYCDATLAGVLPRGCICPRTAKLPV